MSYEYRPDRRRTVDTEAERDSAAARTWRPLVQPGMHVAGIAGDIIGSVREVGAAAFLVDRSGSLGMAPQTPVSLPYDRIHVMLSDKMTLDVPSSQVDDVAEEG